MDTASARRHTGSFRAAFMVGAACCLLGGCKSGSWMTKPSWWTFGGSTDASTLATAPAYDGVAKPSASAQPYPTTSTPEGYSLADAAGATGGGNALPPADAAAVTYGTRPPATTAPAAAPPAAAATTAALPAPTTGLSTISPQVGPYAALPPETRSAAPAIAATPPAGYSEAPATATLPATPRSEIAGARVADARPGDSWPATIPAPGTDSRYGSGSGSRFGSPPDALAPAQAIDALPTAPPASLTPSAAVAPAAAALAPPPATLMPPPAVAPPPAAAPDGTPPIPTRRPDRGYRPGGTSSYRPSRTLLADEPAPPDADVQPASFAAPVENTR